jgi:hypothetical protein
MKITANNNRTLIFDNPVFDNNNRTEKYRLTFQSPELTTSMNVYNAPYGTSLNYYFDDLAQNWQGWDQSKNWRSLEGEFSLETFMSKTGHANMQVKMYIYGRSEDDSVVKINLDIEAGQLEKISNEVKNFFKI